jgi:putative Mn2+ efflux pump MntP
MEFLKWCRLQWDRALAVAAVLGGIVMVIVGWVGVSGTPFIAKQVPYVVSDGIGGLVLIIIGTTLWLSADMNDEWRTLDRLADVTRRQAMDRSDLAVLAERVRELESRTELSRTS